MNYSTTPSLLEKIANLTKLNSKFHRYQQDKINQDDSVIISPVEATLIYIGRIEKAGQLISKFNKEINLQQTIGKQAELFSNGFYMNFYLSPRDKHYWRIPYESKLISTKVNNGKAKIPIIIGLERFFPKTDFLEKAIKRNASVGSVFQTKGFPYAIIAIGSLNVNSIHTIKKDYFQKGDIGGYFNLGSSMLLCFPKSLEFKLLIKSQTKVDIGKEVIKIFKNIKR